MAACNVTVLSLNLHMSVAYLSLQKVHNMCNCKKNIKKLRSCVLRLGPFQINCWVCCELLNKFYSSLILFYIWLLIIGIEMITLPRESNLELITLVENGSYNTRQVPFNTVSMVLLTMVSNLSQNLWFKAISVKVNTS